MKETKKTKKTKKDENLLEEIYEGYMRTNPIIDDNKYSLCAVGALMDDRTLYEYPMYCSKRHVFSLHEGDCVYIKVLCHSGVKNFMKAWRKKHRLKVTTMFQDYSDAFNSDVVICDSDNITAYIQVSCPRGWKPFLHREITINIMAGCNDEYQTQYTLTICDFAPEMLHLTFTRGSVTLAPEHYEYTTFKYGEHRQVGIATLCNNPWKHAFEDWELLLEYVVIVRDESDSIIYSHIGNMLTVNDSEGNPDRDYLATECFIEDISGFPIGTYTVTTYFMGEEQHSMEFVIGYEEVKGKQASRVSSREAKKITRQPISDSMAQLESLIGLTTLKTDVKRNLHYVTLMQARKKVGLPTGNRIMNMIFSGNPGSGKTTVARIMGSLLMEIGILSKGHLIEANRETMLGQYIGETEKRTKDLIEKAKGGVLFIDEAYSLMPRGGEGDRDFGRHAIDTLMTVLSEPDNDLIVIMAGYTDKMEALMNSNPGLSSRFPIKYDFPDYTQAELMDIAMLYFDTNRYTLDGEAKQLLQRLFNEAVSVPNFGNGRYVKTLIENCILPNMGQRIATTGDFDDIDMLCRIEPADIPTMNPVKNLNAQQRKSIGFNVSR